MSAPRPPLKLIAMFFALVVSIGFILWQGNVSMPTPNLTRTLVAFETQKASAAQTLAYINTKEPIVDPPRPTGIVEMSDPSFAAQGYAIQNYWQQQLDRH